MEIIIKPKKQEKIYEYFPEYDKYVGAQQALKNITQGKNSYENVPGLLLDIVEFWDAANSLQFFAVEPEAVRGARRTLSLIQTVKSYIADCAENFPAAEAYYYATRRDMLDCVRVRTPLKEAGLYEEAKEVYREIKYTL